MPRQNPPFELRASLPKGVQRTPHLQQNHSLEVYGQKAAVFAHFCPGELLQLQSAQQGLEKPLRHQKSITREK